MNLDRDRALIELTRRNPFWVCLMVFGLLAVDSAFRLANSTQQRKQLEQAQFVQVQNASRMSSTLQQLPQIEARLQALSLDLIQVSKTNATAGQIVREFNIQWNPGPESMLAAPALPAALSSPEKSANAPAAPATNASPTQ